MSRKWTKQSNEYIVKNSGFVLAVSHSHDGMWDWHVYTPDGFDAGWTEDTLEEAKAEAEKEARTRAIELANRLFAKCRSMGALTPEEQDWRAKALGFLGNTVTWNAYLGDSLMGSGPTPEQAIEDAAREYEDAIGYDEDRIASREELEEQLTVCLAEDE